MNIAAHHPTGPSPWLLGPICAVDSERHNYPDVGCEPRFEEAEGVKARCWAVKRPDGFFFLPPRNTRDTSCATGFSFFPPTLIPFWRFQPRPPSPSLHPSTPLPFFPLRSGSLSARALTSGFELRPAWFSAGMEGLYFSMAPLATSPLSKCGGLVRTLFTSWCSFRNPDCAKSSFWRPGPEGEPDNHPQLMACGSESCGRQGFPVAPS